MFVWIFHRVSGLVLIFLIGFKIVTGYGILGRYGTPPIETMRTMHRSVLLDLLITLLFIYHALYGLRTCLVDLGVKGEKILFWCFTILGGVVFALVAWLLILRGPAA
jgi:succinate dehydrogenase/fumarate reductase cytochrome b subunit